MSLQSEMENAIEDPSRLLVDGFDVDGALFIVPFDAPLPAEVPVETLPTGSLYARLSRLAGDDELKPYGFAALSGAELIGLQQVWKVLVKRKKIFVLFDLPGARYDVLFTQATKQLGLRRVDWPSVSEAISSRAVALQRANDKTPYAISDTARRTPLAGLSRSGFETRIEAPALDDSEES